MSDFPVIHKTNRLIILCYPLFSGGKFVANCLAFSKHCHPQHRDLLGISYADFYTELQNRFDLVGNEWVDLHMGCNQLFGFDWEKEQDWNYPVIPRYVQKMFEGDVYFCKTAHGDAIVKGYKCLFPNAQVINFVNCADFINSRGEQAQLDIDVDSVYEWDCDWFRDAQKTSAGIKDLYSLLDMPDWNLVEEYIEPYRQRWLDTILK